ncbi:MAG: GNAT family N-acetyltransferase [Thermomicrobiales bacterium]
MRFYFRSLTQADAVAIAAWHYPAPYTFYDFASDPDDLAELLDPARRGATYFAVTDETGALAGFWQIQMHGTTAEIGLGLRPDMTGRGLGLAFLKAGLAFTSARCPARQFSLTVAVFNERAIRVYQRAGFQATGRYWQATNGGRYEYIRMIRAVETD